MTEILVTPILTPEHIVGQFKGIAHELDAAIRAHPLLRQFFTREFSGTIDERVAAYAAYLGPTSRYIPHTRTLAQAGGDALKGSDDPEDQYWSKEFFHVKDEETDRKDPQNPYGHDIWAIRDMETIGVPKAFMQSRSPSVEIVATGSYPKYMIAEAQFHPYGGMGAKGVLEHLAISFADDMVDGLRASGIPGIKTQGVPEDRKVWTEEDYKGVEFLGTHGKLDIVHTQEGNHALMEHLQNPAKLAQILDGAHVTRRFYHSLLQTMHEAYEECRQLQKKAA